MHSLQRVIGIELSVLLALGTLVAIAAPAQAQEEFDVLVFSKTAGFRHGSIPDGIAAIEELGEQHNFGVTATEDASQFTTDNLQQYEAVIWLSTTGDVLNESQQAAFEEYIKGGGGYTGIHAAADTEYEWSFYGNLVGAYFDSHPQIQEADVKATDRVHPSTQHLPTTWARTDEWYNYATNPRGDVRVLATLDESSYDPGDGAMGVDHPIAWCQDHQGGRSWYTGMGHTPESFDDPQFREHLLGGIQTAAGAVDADCGVSNWSNFDQVTLAQGPDNVGEPMGMAVLPGGGVLHSERQGTLYHTTSAGETSVAAEIPVYTHDEEGLQSIGLDPNFADNGWVYVYYAPPLDTPSGDAPETSDDPSDFDEWKGHNQLSRFKFADGELDLSSEQQILQVDASRGMCCHVGGDIDFGPDGNLYLSTGDDSNPFQSSGYSPIDERETRYPAFDAQRTSANTNDLRGKLLRIDVGSDGSYTVPEDNMFAGDGGEATRPEIYAMGFRNPYRFSVDSETGIVYLGDYGPDAGSADPERGPAGQVEFNRITEPGFYGWPYCTGKNDAYHDYDFATGESGQEFDCAGGPANDSPNNDGRAQLPAAVPAWLAYDGDSIPEFGDGSESPMGGPVYRHDPDGGSETGLPAYYDGKFFAYEWGRGWIKTITMGEGGQPAEIDPFFPSMELTRPMDVEFGPDGSLYVLDYGSGYFGGAEDSALYRIDYVKGQRSPNAVMSAEPTSGRAPLEVQFSAEGSSDPDPGSSLTYAWDFDGDGQADTSGPQATYTYEDDGEYDATLTVTDDTGKSATASDTIVVGNTEPDVSIRVPKDGQAFEFGDTINYTVTVKDPDGTKFECSEVEVEYILGHSTGNDSHGHPLSRSSGCQGTIETSNTDGHQGADIYGVLHASYTDTSPTPDAPALTGEDETILQPKTKQAEYFSGSQGVQVVQNDDAQAGERVGYINPGDWISFQPYNLAGVDSVSFRVSSGGSGGTIEVRSGSPDGPLVATTEVPNTGGYDNYQTVGPVSVDDPGGTAELFLVFRGSGSGGLFDVDSLTVHGKGAGAPECEPIQPGEGYTSLFDGTHGSRQGWTQAGPGYFEHTGECTLRSVGGMGLYWHSAETFEAPYSLKLDWKIAGDDNSGVFVGFPDPEGDPWSAVTEGEEVQIDPTEEPANRTGAIYDEQAPDADKRDEALNPAGEWNTYEIVVTQEAITVSLNGTEINHWVDDDENVDLSRGHIGLQNHGDADEAYFRNVAVNTDPDVTPPEVSAQLDPSEPNGDPYGKYEGTYHTPVDVSISADDGDGSGVAGVQYRLDGGDWTAYSGSLTVEEPGEHAVDYRATDEAGNTAQAGTVSFEIVPDACPGSDIRDTVRIDGRDTGVDNVDAGDGCTINDLIAADGSYESQGAFVSHVDQVTDELVADGVITDEEKGRVMRAAGRSDIGR